MKLYLNAHPETIVSLAFAGRLPDNSMSRLISLFEKMLECSQASKYHPSSTYLVEMELDAVPLNSTLVFKEGVNSYQVETIDSSKIRKVSLLHLKKGRR